MPRAMGFSPGGGPASPGHSSSRGILPRALRVQASTGSVRLPSWLRARGALARRLLCLGLARIPWVSFSRNVPMKRSTSLLLGLTLSLSSLGAPAN